MKRVVRVAQRAETVIAAPERALIRRGTLGTEHLTLPHFLGLGAPKSGSTWLHHNLDRHPEVFVPPEKELHYFCHFHHRSIRWYSSKFSQADARMRGEITPNYAELPSSLVDEIADLMPDLRLLLMMRDPVDRAWSHAQMNLARQKNRTVESVPKTEYIAHFRSAHSIDSGDYLAIVDRWSARFPEERMWLGTYDDMVERPEQLLASVFDFLGVDSDVDWEAFPTSTVIDRGRPGSEDLVGRRGGGSELPDDLRTELERIWTPRIEAMAERFGPAAERWLP